MIKKDSTERFTPSPCNCLNLRRAALSMTKLYDRHLSPCGLTVSQYSLLRHLRTLGSVSVSALADKIRLDRTTLVRNLLPLEKEGLIIDVSAPGARSRELQLTEKGTAISAEADQLWDNAQHDVEHALGKENIALLTSLLSRLENIEE
jgi:DNA-binding MarR family transcriptional regulator